MRGWVLPGTLPALAIALSFVPFGLTKARRNQVLEPRMQAPSCTGKGTARSPLLLAASASYLVAVRRDWSAWLSSLPPSPIDYCTVLTGTWLAAHTIALTGRAAIWLLKRWHDVQPPGGLSCQNDNAFMHGKKIRKNSHKAGGKQTPFSPSEKPHS
ncbi:hypothetical protein GX51_05091 [Blastomyces parvus]|uniref:Uncharacterized protein n=1 Tax=Blastomyces parvus TaxID=2060905 RepID=A0A2B7WYG7_9EURO|nr:hypothetical protein GX51_05091 [Blastomyces parvus]